MGEGRAWHSRRSSKACGFAAAGIALLGASLVPARPPRLLWNASASMPIGLYALASPAPARRGDIVAAWLPPAVRAFAAGRGYLPPGVPVLKRIAALRGDRVCADGAALRVGGRVVALAKARDGRGRPLAPWRGCGILQRGVLLIGDSADSFDARYFGPVGEYRLIGAATLLWRR